MPNTITKKDEAYQAIKGAIIAGQLESARIISIAELSEIFDIGRTPIREALVVLASEGFIEAIPRFGYQVKSFSVQDMLEIFHLRSILEVEGVGLTATRISDDEIRLLEENNRLEQQLIKSLNSDKSTHSYNEGYELNLEFHLIIARASGNFRLAGMVEKLLYELERVLDYDPGIAELEKAVASAKQHMEIIDRLRMRDKLGSQEAMKMHIEDVKNLYLSRFE